MSDHVYWMLEMSMKDGQLDAFKALRDEMVQDVEANEPGTLNYEWWMNGDETVCHLFERYADSEATLVHLQTFGTKYADRFMACVDIKRFIAYGDPNEAVRKALGGLGVKIMNPFGGFTR